VTGGDRGQEVTGTGGGRQDLLVFLFLVTLLAVFLMIEGESASVLDQHAGVVKVIFQQGVIATKKVLQAGRKQKQKQDR